jgi:type I site-specific restriction endonuclease
LFLVDRGNLATNAKDEFEQFVIPHDGRKFTQHYNVNILGRARRAQIRSWRICQLMVEVMQPKPTDTVADPACGTGGFLLAA